MRWCASRRPPLGVRLFLSHFAVPRSPILAATFMPPRGRPTLVVLPPVASSSVASLSSASFCDGAAAFFTGGLREVVCIFLSTLAATGTCRHPKPRN